MKMARCVKDFHTIMLSKHPLTLGRLYRIVEHNKYGMTKVVCDDGTEQRYNTRRFKVIDIGLNNKVKIL